MIEIRREKFSKIYFSKKRPHKKVRSFLIYMNFKIEFSF
ncbi:hypothetical protein LEP1GSC016_4347 [Leptospira borgpetersenii serovar Hardjo-bovis str. Sponselee]|uniref:Uncharacterized protein n=1 Tax=Leptospira borgpetersenii serovar Hardjo-bovis str. Sponselee TaxID=1303729 RepID=M6BNR0_LEPBO|nr:hypothetical protein LEP1GSC016_4347 [Leptospira borgpetersenii serovar Hardjo-bovis str. Sponselee]